MFEEIVSRVGRCIKRARELTQLSEEEVRAIDVQIETAFKIIETDFRDELSAFLTEQGVTEKLRKISLSVVKALGDIDGYNVQPEVGMITIIKGQVAMSQPLTPLASASSLYFSITPENPNFDFILACLSRQEYFEVLQLHHYFRNHPSQGAYRAGMQPAAAKAMDDFDAEEAPVKKKKKAS
jgi:hypothetical protein